MTLNCTQWGLHEFRDQKEIRLNWARLRVRLIRRDRDLLLVEIRDDREIVELGDDPESDFRRYAFERNLRAIRVLPMMPDRPILVQPLHPLRLAPKAEVEFYLSIPVDIQLSTPVPGPTDPALFEPLERLQSEILSDSWFGDQIQGVFCYALKSRARRERPQLESGSDSRAICKIKIENSSEVQLHVSKFCLRLERCHIWQKDNELWSSPIHIRYRGTDQLTAIDYYETAPEELGDCTRIADAEKDPTENLISRTFSGIGSAFASI
ncbi:MAG: DUF432 domain-containing protein [Verrucomicrobia bacterium]|jgi:hypothetical protein|nr:DUF432 domain-containing protein [Verrucomicrobiota bacterium]